MTLQFDKFFFGICNEWLMGVDWVTEDARRVKLFYKNYIIFKWRKVILVHKPGTIQIRMSVTVWKLKKKKKKNQSLGEVVYNAWPD